jgi:hypothetical protein
MVVSGTRTLFFQQEKGVFLAVQGSALRIKRLANSDSGRSIVFGKSVQILLQRDNLRQSLN